MMTSSWRGEPFNLDEIATPIYASDSGSRARDRLHLFAVTRFCVRAASHDWLSYKVLTRGVMHTASRRTVNCQSAYLGLHCSAG